MLTTIVKPTRDCNLACKYCYTEVRETGERMGLDVLVNFLDKAKQWEGERNPPSTSTHIIWHGGEPLLMGIGFFEQVVQLQAERSEGFAYHNSVQTNGTLLTPEFYQFLKEHGFGIGLSLDGPREINDRTRVRHDGSSSFDDVMRAIRLIQKEKGRTGVITVVSRENISRLDEVLAFCEAEGISPKLNPLIPSGCAREESDLAISPAEYGRVMSGLFSRWFETADQGYCRVDTFLNLMRSVMEGRPYGCDSHRTCQDTFLAMAPNGDLYPCCRFDGVAEYRLGNILEDDIATVMAHPAKQRINERFNHLDECHACDYVQLCNGGCAHNAYLAGNIDGKDIYCPANKVLFHTIKTTVLKALRVAEVK